MHSSVGIELDVGLDLKGRIGIWGTCIRSTCLSSGLWRFRCLERKLLVCLTVVLDNLAKLELLLALLNRLGRLDVVVLALNAVEARSLEILHRLLAILAVRVVLLDVADHCLIADGVEGFLGAGGQVCELRNITGEWVLQLRFLQIVAEICDESLSIVELDQEGLGVNRRPLSSYYLF